MSDNANSEANVEYIRDLLSPYLDGEVSDEEQALVEQAIATSSELRRELESLRQTVALLQNLAPVPAPRPFTLSEADTRPVAAGPKKSFWLSGWARGFAIVATTILCVAIAAGGLLFTAGRQMSSEVALAPLAEPADRVENAAPQAAEAEAGLTALEAATGQPTESPAIEEPAAAPPAALELEKEETIVESESAETPAQEEAATTETELDAARQATTDDTASAGEATQLAESQDVDESNIEKSVGNAEQAPAVTPTATPNPTLPGPILSTPTPTLAFASTPTPEAAAQAAAPQEGAAETTETTMAQAAPAEAQPVEPQPMGDQEEAQAEAQAQEPLYRDETARLRAEIRDPKLEVQPGLIQITGSIEAPAGTRLTVSLQRNQRPFNEWADPASLQSAVQPDGRFSFAIRAQENRPDADLFAADPADYDISITSVEGSEVISATLSFETFARPAAPAQVTATPLTATPTATPLPSATPTARPEALISPATAPPPSPQLSAEEPTDTAAWLVGSGVLILLIILGLVGVVIWLRLGKKSY